MSKSLKLKMMVYGLLLLPVLGYSAETVCLLEKPEKYVPISSVHINWLKLHNLANDSLFEMKVPAIVTLNGPRYLAQEKVNFSLLNFSTRCGVQIHKSAELKGGSKLSFVYADFGNVCGGGFTRSKLIYQNSDGTKSEHDLMCSEI
ncbi:MAG: hypothetical protein M9962_07690 [Oligoflexia bacterium]|nr:hypothetical protein [Oligoflexia bacterium]